MPPGPAETSLITPGVSRLAPSPTGALHLGNARTFLVNWAIARKRRWRLVLRIEDLDTPRIKPGAADDVLRTLEWLGIDWDPWLADGRRIDTLVQSEDLEPYRAAMRSLAARGRAYPCQLSRAQIEAAASAPQEGAHDIPFPAELRPPGAGTPVDFDALDAARDGAEPPNWRLIVPPGSIRFEDHFAGPQGFDPSRIVGDFVIWTRRRQPSYQLAVVVDDHRQAVTQVVRGDDLLDSAARQLLLYRTLGLRPEPEYTHLPLVRGHDGKRLAKRHGDTRLERYRAMGVPAEAVIGLVARWCGIGSPHAAPEPMTAERFMSALDLSTIPAEPVTFTHEDDQWLLSQVAKTV